MITKNIIIGFILVLLYGSSFYILYNAKLKRVLKMGIVITSIYSFLSLILLFYPSNLSYVIKSPMQNLLLGVSLAIIIFIPLYNKKIISCTYYGYRLQDTLRKNIIFLIIPLVILMYFNNDFSFLSFQSVNLWLLLIMLICIGIASYLWNKVNKSALFIKTFGKKIYTLSVLITFCVQIIHTAIPEEFFFRVFLISAMQPLLGETLAIVISSLVFGISHVWFFDRNRKLKNRVAQSITVHVTLGIFLSLIWTRFAVFYVNVFLHALINSLGIAVTIGRQLYLKKNRSFSSQRTNGLRKVNR